MTEYCPIAGATTGPLRSEALCSFPEYWRHWAARGAFDGIIRAESVPALHMAKLLHLMAGILHLVLATVSLHLKVLVPNVTEYLSKVISWATNKTRSSRVPALSNTGVADLLGSCAVSCPRHTDMHVLLILTVCQCCDDYVRISSATLVHALQCFAAAEGATARHLPKSHRE